MHTPVNPSFFYIKVVCKGVFITRTCYPDDNTYPEQIAAKVITATIAENKHGQYEPGHKKPLFGLNGPIREQ